MFKLLKIGADWCNNCNILNVQLKLLNIKYIDINIDNIDDIKEDFINNYTEEIYNLILKTDKLPTIYILDNNKLIKTMIGYNINRLDELKNLLIEYKFLLNLDYNEEF